MTAEDGSGWRGSDTPKTRLASADDVDDSRVETADGEFPANDDSRVNAADYEEDVPESEDNSTPRSNPVRKSNVTIRASEDGAEVGVE